MIVRLTRWVLRNKALVLTGWLLATVAGALAVTPATEAMTPDFGALPGRPGYETNQEILRTYGHGGAADPLVLVVTLPAGITVDSPGVAADLTAAVDAAKGAAAGATGGGAGGTTGARTVSYPSTGDRGLVSADGRTTIALLYPPAGETFPPYATALPAVTTALAARPVAGAPVRLTGTDALFVESGDADGPGLLAEVTIAAAGALLVLAAVFGSVLAVVPLLTAVIAILVTFLAVWGLTAVTDVSFVVQFLVGLIGLGVAIDYALLVTTRWREERARGLDNTAAVEQAMRTAGSAVVFSGVTVAVALAVLILVPVPFLRAMGIAGLLIPLFSVLVAVTLLPVLLATVGPRFEWPRRRPAWPVTPARVNRRWAAWAGFVVRHPVVVATVAILALAALIVPAASLRLGTPAPESAAASGPARDALDRLGPAGLGTGLLSPVYLLVDDPATQPAAVAATARAVPGVRAALAPADPTWRRDGTALVVVLPHDPTGTTAGARTRDRLADAFAGTPGVRIGGTAAQGRDFVDAVYGGAPLLLGLVVLITVALLVYAFRSVLLAVKAVVLNAISVTATMGLLVLAWQDGHLAGAVWDIDPTGALTEWVPVMVFAFLFGLSMDYEVFILARIREEHDAGRSDRDATVAGIAATGRLVTSAALILFLAFVSLAATPGTEVKIFATALGIGILLDATVVRAMLVPALVVLFGRANWWLPRRRRIRCRPPAELLPAPDSA